MITPYPRFASGGLKCVLRTFSSGPPRRLVKASVDYDDSTPRSTPRLRRHPSVATTQSDVGFSREQMDKLTIELGHPDSWNLIYRLKSMPIVQAFSRLKLLLTATLLVGSPISLLLNHMDLVNSELCWFTFGATTFSLCTLCVFSYFSTRLIGVVSLHTESGLLRLGLLSFWGRRWNLLVRPDQLLPSDDMSDTNKRTVTVGLTGDAKSAEDYAQVKKFYLSVVTSEVRNEKLFRQYLGSLWR